MEVYQAPDNVDIEQIDSRYAIWVITGKGPFKEFLYKIGITDNPFSDIALLDRKPLLIF